MQLLLNVLARTHGDISDEELSKISQKILEYDEVSRQAVLKTIFQKIIVLNKLDNMQNTEYQIMDLAKAEKLEVIKLRSWLVKAGIVLTLTMLTMGIMGYLLYLSNSGAKDAAEGLKRIFSIIKIVVGAQ